MNLKPKVKTYYDRQCKVWVAHDSTLGVASQGETKKEAMEAIDEAIMLFLITCYEHGQLGNLPFKSNKKNSREKGVNNGNSYDPITH